MQPGYCAAARMPPRSPTAVRQLHGLREQRRFQEHRVGPEHDLHHRHRGQHLPRHGLARATGRQLSMTRLDLRSERGFTLIELTVATLIGTIVSAATLAIVIVSVHLSSNYGDRVDATQQGRIAMAKITQALNSSCVSAKLPPVLPNTVDPANTISAISHGHDVWFYSRSEERRV